MVEISVMLMYNYYSMGILKGVGDFFGLDIGTSSVRVVQLTRRNNKDGEGEYSLKHFGYVPVDAKTVLGSSKANQDKLGEIIMTAIGQSGIKTKNVAIGLPSSKSFTTVIDVANQTEAELKKTIKYQIDQYIPMSIDEAKVDWALLGQSSNDPEKQEVLLASTAIEYAETRLEFIENLGLDVIAAEPDQIAMSRSLDMPDGKTANFIVDFGESSTDLAIVYDGAPRLVRSVPIGLSTLVKAAVSNLDIKEEQARQFIIKFGLAPDKLEGRVYRALESNLDNFAGELNKSIKFFKNKYPNVEISRIIASGFASVIPMMNNYIANKTNMATSIGTPWYNVALTKQQQQDLANISAEFAVAVGLAQRSAE